MTTTKKPIISEALLWETSEPSKHFKVYEDKHGAYVLEDNEWLIEDELGVRSIARFTGRTRFCWDRICPTVERFDIDTIANSDGVILGVKGAKINGTLATFSWNLAWPMSYK